jgi:hypothetical protein
MERLREYNDLADQYDATYKDTVEEAEKTGGFIEVRPVSKIDNFFLTIKSLPTTHMHVCV